MTSPRTHTRTQPPPLPPYQPKETPPVILPGRFGDDFLATEEEVAERDRQEAERLAKANDHLDSVLAFAWACQACGTGNALGSGAGLCGPCTVVANQLRAEAAATDDINGTSRRHLCEQYLARQV